MVNTLIFANLVIRPVRTLVSIAAVGVEVLLILMVVGLTHGILEETAKRTQGVGAEIMVQPQTTSALMSFSGAPMPIQIRDRLAEVPQVKAVAPVMMQVNSTGGLTLIYGIDETRTYGDLANQLDAAPRAIGQACGRNPIPILIPCHRVLAADGLGGYSGGKGLETKRRLLMLEGALLV